ncbi:MAG: helix-turn-helix transcriptional regulator [Oscillospiraceae bacterium]|jgi:AraC-like DNA-binding protein|nr:helix-turn-helix transcriptional regulator [Oscillospiraceae bacterium]
MNEWMLRGDLRWTVEDIRLLHLSTGNLYPARAERLCLLRARAGQATVVSGTRSIALVGNRMLLADTALPCTLSQGSEDLRLEAVRFCLSQGRFGGGTPLLQPFSDHYELLTPLTHIVRSIQAVRPLETANQMLHLYIQYVLLSIFNQAAGRVRRAGNDYLDRAMAYIDQHSTSGIAIADIAAFAGVSARHLQRLFLAFAGVPLGAYLLSQRMGRVEHLLMHTDFSIAEIARLTGFASSQYLAHAFHKHRGLAPLAFRRGYNITSPYDPADGYVTPEVL